MIKPEPLKLVSTPLNEVGKAACCPGLPKVGGCDGLGLCFSWILFSVDQVLTGGHRQWYSTSCLSFQIGIF